MKFGIIKERKNPPDKRVVFSPNKIDEIQKQFPQLTFKVEPSEVRIFEDSLYQNLGIAITEDLSDCDVLFGVKEVPIENLIPNKKYFFFSHTLKKQLYNRKLLQAILDKKIDLYDHETIVDAEERRLIGFGVYAGIVGTYNAIRAFGIKFELFKIPKASSLKSKEDLINQLKRQILPPIKITVTGKGKVGSGIKEILVAMKIKEVTADHFLNKTYSGPVFTQIDALEYNKRSDGTVIDIKDFYQNPQDYESDFEKFTKVSDIYISGHFHGSGAPSILTQKMLQASDNKIKIVADISCDVKGPIACTLRASTIEEPLYGYLPSENKEVDVFHPAAIVVMAVDNLPCELPKDASEGFGQMFAQFVIPAFCNGDVDGILARAQMTDNGRLTKKFEYLQDFVDESN
ncbi:MAG: NAD(P)-dependent oxidoreductase [Flavobacterium sp.]